MHWFYFMFRWTNELGSISSFNILTLFSSNYFSGIEEPSNMQVDLKGTIEDLWWYYLIILCCFVSFYVVFTRFFVCDLLLIIFSFLVPFFFVFICSLYFSKPGYFFNWIKLTIYYVCWCIVMLVRYTRVAY